MKRVSFIIICIILLSACGSSRKVAEDNATIRWPDFLREWAADYEITEPQRLAIINQIDTLYQLIEDSTTNDDMLCAKLCQMQDVISDAIKYDSSLVFPLMMRATCRNIYGVIYRNPWLLEKDCSCELLDYLLLDAQWCTSSRENLDLMYTTITGLSWQASDRFANLMLTKEDGSELSTAILFVYNYFDTVIDNLHISFTDSAGSVIETLSENDTYVDVPGAGVKNMFLPPYLLMNALAANGTLTISYDTPQGTFEMVGFPHIHFMKQIEDCPRLKEILYKALDEKQ